MNTQHNIPEHVPSGLVFDFDYINDTAAHLNPFDGFKELLKKKPPEVFYAPHYGGHWVACSYRAIQDIYRDHENFTSVPILIPAIEVDAHLIPQQIDPPDHGRYRRILGPLFTPAATRKMESHIRTTARDLINKFADEGACDFVEDFALRLPTYAFLDLMGIPRDRVAEFVEWDRLMLAGTPEEQAGAQQSIVGFLAEFAEQKSHSPDDNWMSYLLSLENDGAGELKLTRPETLNIAMMLFVAGLDTVLNTLGHAWRYLAENAAKRKALVDDPELIPEAAEEFLRIFAVVNGSRRARHDVEFMGVKMKKGDAILLPTSVASMDPEFFENPTDVDFEREGNVHLAFGTGIHRCLGSNIARLEMRISLEEWLNKIPEFEIPAGAEFNVFSGVTMGLRNLPLTWKV